MHSRICSLLGTVLRAHSRPQHRNVFKMAAQPGTMEQGMGVAKDGWFTELSSLWPGQGMSLKIDEVIFQGRSDFQVRHPVCISPLTAGP